MRYRFAAVGDIPALARLNQHLVEDEGHRNRHKSYPWLEDRMRSFLQGDYRAVLFEDSGQVVGYALYIDDIEQADTIYLRQFFVRRDCRRQGIGRRAFRLLKDEIWPPGKRLTVGVLWRNEVGRAFWEAVGFTKYALELEMHSES